MRELTTAFSVLHILFLCVSGAIQLIMVMTPFGDRVLAEGQTVSTVWMEVVPNLLALFLLLTALWYFARLVKGLPEKREAVAIEVESDPVEVQDLRQRVNYLEEQLESMHTMLLDRY